jgi:uncharacterized LabA/DUF88 family protein
MESKNFINCARKSDEEILLNDELIINEESENKPLHYSYWDNSYLFIQGQDIFGDRKDSNTRINITKLKNILEYNYGDFEDIQAFGSHHKCQDKLEKIFNKSNIKLSLQYRHKDCKEKKVKTNMIVEIMNKISLSSEVNTSSDKKPYITLITGNSTFIPLINNLINKNWNIVIYSWKNSISNELLEISQNFEERVKVNYLDDLNITFVRYKWIGPLPQEKSIIVNYLSICNSNKSVDRDFKNAFKEFKDLINKGSEIGVNNINPEVLINNDEDTIESQLNYFSTAKFFKWIGSDKLAIVFPAIKNILQIKCIINILKNSGIDTFRYVEMCSNDKYNEWNKVKSNYLKRQQYLGSNFIPNFKYFGPNYNTKCYNYLQY